MCQEKVGITKEANCIAVRLMTKGKDMFAAIYGPRLQQQRKLALGALR